VFSILFSPSRAKITTYAFLTPDYRDRCENARNGSPVFSREIEPSKGNRVESPKDSCFPFFLILLSLSCRVSLRVSILHEGLERLFTPLNSLPSRFGVPNSNADLSPLPLYSLSSQEHSRNWCCWIHRWVSLCLFRCEMFVGSRSKR